MTYKLAFLSTAFLILCASCTKHANEPLSTSVRPLESSDSIISPLSNPQNPYDSIGQVHNAVLADVMPNVFSGALAPSWTAEGNYGDSLLINSFHFSSTFVGAFNTAFNTAYDSTISTYDFPTLVDSLENAGDLSLSMPTFLDSLYDYLTVAVADSFPTPSVYNTFANHVIELEHKIKENLMIQQSDSVSVYACTSIARYSTAYWMNIENSGNPPGFLKKVIKVISADLNGALGGAGTGASIATQTHNKPVGAAIAGGIIGGVHASINSGGKKN
jgi:hypothetical protein